MPAKAGTDFLVTVTTTATLIRANPNVGTAGALRHLLTIRNTSASTDLYWGNDTSVDAGVTRGFLLKAGESYDIEAHTDIYGITAAGSAVVSGWEEVN